MKDERGNPSADTSSKGCRPGGEVSDRVEEQTDVIS